MGHAHLNRLVSGLKNRLYIILGSYSTRIKSSITRFRTSLSSKKYTTFITPSNILTCFPKGISSHQSWLESRSYPSILCHAIHLRRSWQHLILDSWMDDWQRKDQMFGRSFSGPDKFASMWIWEWQRTQTAFLGSVRWTTPHPDGSHLGGLWMHRCWSEEVGLWQQSDVSYPMQFSHANEQPNSINGIMGNALLAISRGIRFDVPDLFIRNLTCAADSPQPLKPYAPWIMYAIE